MKKFFKYALILLGIDVLLFAVLALKPVPQPSDLNHCEQLSGTVDKVFGGGNGDLILSLVGDNRNFYINRLLLSSESSFEEWHKKLKGKQVNLYYPRYWTPLDHQSKLRHLTQLETTEGIVWTELQGD